MLRAPPQTFAQNNMKISATISVLFAFLIASVFADESEPKLMDFVLPVPENFVVSAAGALKARKQNIAYYLEAQGIKFPEGSSVELNDEKMVLIVRLPHREALNLTQIINAFMGESATEVSKEFLEGGRFMEGPENRCFGPLPK